MLLFPVLIIATTPAHSATMFVGTYTDPQGSKGIYRIQLDTDTGRLSDPVLAAQTENPSYIAIDFRSRYLYAVNERTDGTVSAFRIGNGNTLRPLNVQSTRGQGPCHLSVGPGGKTVMAANYSDGSLVCYPIRKDGSLGSPQSTFKNAGVGPDKSRQERSHMHWIDSDSSGRTVYACDLGTDELLVYKSSLRQGRLDLGFPIRVKAEPGTGPRHGVVDRAGKFLYVDSEMGNTVSVYAVSGSGSPLQEVQRLSTLPNGVSKHVSRTAEIAMHPSGRWLYVSNRGYDSIAIFGVGLDGHLNLIDVERVSQAEPRGFAVDPTGRWLVVAGQSGNEVSSLEIDPISGRLHQTGSSVRVASPVSILFTPK